MKIIKGYIMTREEIYDNNFIFNNASYYEKNSKTQANQSNLLLERLFLKDNANVLDIGCGNGLLSLKLFEINDTISLTGIDISSDMISKSIANLENSFIDNSKVIFEVTDIEGFKSKTKYDCIFSNAMMHWVKNPKRAYTKIYELLNNGGNIYIHQGGFNTYLGLHNIVKQAIVNLNYDNYYIDWNYPVFYPTANEIKKLLSDIGFKNINVFSKESNGKENLTLPVDFMNAGMLPYIQRLPSSKEQQNLKVEYKKICDSLKDKMNLYSNRLYIFASKD